MPKERILNILKDSADQCIISRNHEYVKITLQIERVIDWWKMYKNNKVN